MPWSYPDNVPASMKYLKPSIQKKAIAISNHVLQATGDEGKAIAIGISKAKSVHDKKVSIVKLAATLSHKNVVVQNIVQAIKENDQSYLKKKYEKLKGKIRGRKKMSIIKLAQARWRSFLSAASSTSALKNNVGKLLVGSQAPKTYGQIAKGYAGLTQNLAQNAPLSKEMLDQSKRFVGAGLTRPNIEVNPLHTAITKRGLGKPVAPVVSKSGMASSKIQNPIGGEEFHDIAHGGDFHSLNARLKGNAPYPLQAPANVNGRIQTNGMQVIKQNSDMHTAGVTSGYARNAAEMKGTTPGLLTGRIQGKYLFPNPTVKGEFAIPHEHMSKIINGQVKSL